jgi:hypothetical protein
MPLSSAVTTAQAAFGGIPAAGTIYGGVDGPSSASIPGSSMAGGAPPPDRMSPAPEGERPPPKFYKLEFSTYDGSEDLLNWLSHCEQFFRGQRTLASDRTWLASYHLRGPAQTLYYTLEQSEGMPLWERFKELCHLQYGPPVRDSRLAELGRLPFRSTVQDFSERFNAILCHARNLDNLQKAELFVGGLPNHIRVDVAMCAPQVLPTVMYLVRAFELRANAMLAMVPAAPPWPARPVQPRPQQPVPGLPAGGAGQLGAAALPASRSFRRLTPAEQQECRRQGLCYNCDEPFIRGHQCKRVFYLEARDFTDDNDASTDHETADPTTVEEGTTDARANALMVSLYALAGIRTTNSMVVPVMIKGERFLALLDTGSTNNFLRGDTM